MYIGKHKFDKPYLDKSYLGSGERLKYAYEKYGKDCFTTEILEWTDKNDDDLNKLEIFYIDLFDTFRYPQHYNMSIGGDGGSCISDARRNWMKENYSGSGNPMYNYHWSEEQLKNLSSKMKGKFDGVNNPMYGKVHTRESLSKMRGRVVSDKTKSLLREINTGKVIPEDVKQKIKQSLNKPEVKRIMSEKAKLRVGEYNSNYGNYWSEEQKKEARDKMVGRFSGEKHYWNIKPVVQLDKNTLSFIKKYEYTKQVKEDGFSEYGVASCCKGVQKTSGGFVWKYLKDYEEVM